MYAISCLSRAPCTQQIRRKAGREKVVTHHSNDPKPFTIKHSNQCLMLQGSFQIHVSMTHAPAPSTHCNSSPSIARMRQAQRNTLNDRHLLGKRYIAMVETKLHPRPPIDCLASWVSGNITAWRDTAPIYRCPALV